MRDVASFTGTKPATETADRFRDQGFARVPGILTGEEVARYREASLEAIAHNSKNTDPGNTRIVSTEHVWRTNALLRGLALHPRIAAVAQELAGMPLRVWRGDVLVKDPRDSARTNLHDDETFLAFDSRVSLTAWVALVDVPVERGCMTFLPGSHRRPDPRRVDVGEMSTDPDGYMFRHWPQLRWNTRVTVPLRAGDCTFHHGRTAHMAAANTTEELRVSFIVAFVDAEATYREVPGHTPSPGREPGQPLVDEDFPLAVGG